MTNWAETRKITDDGGQDQDASDDAAHAPDAGNAKMNIQDDQKMNRMLLSIALASITAFAVAQPEASKRLAIVTFSEETFKGTVLFASSTEERITSADGKKVIRLGDVLERLERMCSEGWQILDLEVTEFGSISNGNSAGHGANYTWLLSKQGQ